VLHAPGAAQAAGRHLAGRGVECLVDDLPGSVDLGEREKVIARQTASDALLLDDRGCRVRVSLLTRAIFQSVTQRITGIQLLGEILLDGLICVYRENDP
jgi:hypothetical protein